MNLFSMFWCLPLFMHIGTHFGQLVCGTAQQNIGIGVDFAEHRKAAGTGIIRSSKKGISIIGCNLRCLRDELCVATNFYSDDGIGNGNCELLLPHGSPGQGGISFVLQQNATYSRMQKSEGKVTACFQFQCFLQALNICLFIIWFREIASFTIIRIRTVAPNTVETRI